MSKVIAIIPARGGSKRIYKKNIKDFFSKPLISYSIEVALETALFDRVIVSTDSLEIAEIAKAYGAEVPFIRPKELSDDYTTADDVISHAINYLKNDEEDNIEYICTIYATAPLLQAKYLIKGFENLKNTNAVNAFSATSMPFPIQRTFKIINNRCKMFTPEYYTTRSQDLEEAYQDAGQFYWKKLNVDSQSIMFGSDSIPVILPRHLVQDIDTLEDWKRAEIMFEVISKANNR